MKKLFCSISLLLCSVTCILLFSGCQDPRSSSSAEDSSKKVSKTSEEPPVISPPRALMPETPNKKILGFSPLIIDISNKEQGYIVAITDDSADKFSVQLTGEDAITYSYFLAGDSQAVIPLSAGSGDYTICAYENIVDSQYSTLFSEPLTVSLDNEFYPFLYPNQYVNYSKDSECSKLALSLLPDDATDIEGLETIYNYIITHMTYDVEKANTVEAGYLPDLDETLRTGTGICFDIAALMTAMLRSRDIPCKLQIGYSSSVKHAWIDVYLKGQGWVDKAVFFDGNDWSRMDPTFASANDASDISDYVGDGENYALQYSR